MVLLAISRGLGSKVYILDKAENNALTITDSTGRTHPAWGVSYDVDTNEFRTMDVESNTFCAGGMVLGNGTWAVFGGNQPVTYGERAVRLLRYIAMADGSLGEQAE